MPGGDVRKLMRQERKPPARCEGGGGARSGVARRRAGSELQAFGGYLGEGRRSAQGADYYGIYLQQG